MHPKKCSAPHSLFVPPYVSQTLDFLYAAGDVPTQSLNAFEKKWLSGYPTISPISFIGMFVLSSRKRACRILICVMYLTGAIPRDSRNRVL